MSWISYAFLCALLLSASSIIEKRVLTKVHSVDYSAALAVLNLIFTIPFFFLVDFSRVNGFLLLLMFTSGFLATASFFLVARGTRHLDISTVSPLLSLSPGATSILAFFVLGENLSLYQIIGIALMIVGSYFLTIDPSIGVLKSFRVFTRSYYVHIILLSLLFYSISGLFDRAILHSFSTAIPIYIFFLHFFIAVLFVCFAWYSGSGPKKILQAMRVGGPDIVFGSLFTVGFVFFQMKALQLASVGLVSAVKRSSSFFTTLIGGELFHERNLKRKLIASAVIIVGTIFIVL